MFIDFSSVQIIYFFFSYTTKENILSIVKFMIFERRHKKKNTSTHTLLFIY